MVIKVTQLLEYLDAVRKRREAAARGPWFFQRVCFDDGHFAYEKNDHHSLISLSESDYENPMKAKFDAEFIAAMPDDSEKLEKMVRVLVKALYSYEELFIGEAKEALAEVERIAAGEE